MTNNLLSLKKIARKNIVAFNLIEIMIALAVSVIAIVSIIGIFPLILNSVRDTDNETKAGLIAQSIFSTLRSDYFDEVNLYGKKIDLTSEKGEVNLYATLDMQISDTQNDDTRYLIRIKFNNKPDAYPSQVGNINHVSMVIYWSPPAATIGSSMDPNTNNSAFTGLIAKTTTKP